jgi:transcriptional regulator with XRE-family HTH domain
VNILLAVYVHPVYVPSMTLREYIRLERGRVSAIASGAGISTASVSRIADGKQNPTLDVLKRIEAATGGVVSVAEMSAARAA